MNKDFFYNLKNTQPTKSNFFILDLASNQATKLIYSVFICCLFLSFFSQNVYATHVRAGDLTAERISDISLTYRVTAIIYTDDGGVPPDPEIEFDFGTGETRMVVRLSGVNIGNSTTRNTYTTTYTFPGAGEYNVSVAIRNRNEGIANIPNSVNTAFHIQSTFLINPFLGLNRSPVLLVPPIDFARVGEKFIHNPGAYDADGDSLAYIFVTPKRAINTPVEGFRLLDDSSFGGEREEGGATTATLDPITGDLVWNTPGRTGQFNVAFIVEEWREGVLIGKVNRDMQIIVRDNPNKRPILEIPRDTCVTAGAFLKDTIIGTDPDNDFVRLFAYSALFEEAGQLEPVPPRNYADFNVLNIQPPNGQEKAIFDWQTVCEDVRLQPYAVTFKAEDQPNPSRNKLVDLKTWQIRVVGPKPDTLIAEANTVDNSISLSWFSYQCPNASEMTIWRRVGSFEFNPDTCETGLPAYTGYTQIGTNEIGNLFFLDDNNGEGLERGKTYCYRIFAKFPNPGGGESYVSDEVCVLIPTNAPYITKVSVEETDTQNGEMQVEWTKPQDLVEDEFPRPYEYELFRADGFSGTQNYTQLGERFAENDTIFRDTNLNTEEAVYNYRVLFYSNNNLVDSSAVASSVRLAATPLFNAATLNWSAEVPWNNTDGRFPQHYIHRQTAADGTNFVLLDSINVFSGTFSYTDTGLQDKTEYCYFVTTQGSYNRIGLPEPLLNKSQRICIVPLDETPPCSPTTLFLDSLICETINFEDPIYCSDSLFRNELRWQNDYSPDCDLEVSSYNLYFKAQTNDSLQLLINTTDTTYSHEQVRSVAGCYVVTAVDAAGNESTFSNQVCNDNCPNFALPNVFTPNGDGINDTFRALDCPAFVKSVETKIYSRWEQLVFETNSLDDNNVFIDWNGKNNNGTAMPSGMYFFQVKVTFNRLNPTDEVLILKGWVSLLRE
jgi:gliding motility-associated-like protein